MTGLSGQVVAITGGSAGIGEATAFACARAGAKVAIAARTASRLEVVARRIEQEGSEALGVPADIGEEDQANHFVQMANQRFGRLDALVNCAGAAYLGPITGAPTSEWRRVIHTNVMGLLYCTHAALALMSRQGSGHIVNISSVGGRVVDKYSGIYSLTKFGIGAFSESLRLENLQTGIRVTVIEPGRTDTGIHEQVTGDVGREVVADHADVVPLTPDQVAQTIVFALAQPREVSISEILVRPSRQAM
jgi:clavulanate-9-aldehyde reducatase